MSQDNESRSTAAETVRRLAWETIAEHFHPATQQWAGPHARAYHDRLTPGIARFLSARLPHPIEAPPTADDPADTVDAGTTPQPCPADLEGRFLRLPARELCVRTCFENPGGGELEKAGITWMDDRACLGSVNRETLWTQRRPLLAYWRAGTDPAVTLRLRFLKDGRDFASALLTCRQDRHRAEGEVTFIPDGGNFHLHLDRPADGIFTCSDLRLRFELTGLGARAIPVDAHRWQLAAGGDIRAEVTFRPHPADNGATGDAVFEGRPLSFEAGSDAHRPFPQAWADAVCYHGPPRKLNLRAPAGPSRIPFQLQLCLKEDT